MTPTARSSRARRSRGYAVDSVVLTLMVVVAGLLAAVPAHAAPSRAPSCAHLDRPFTPHTLVIDGVLGPTPVIGRGQDRAGVPKPPPLTERGKWQLAWDEKSGIRPGASAGVVRLTAHTYPRGRTRSGARAPALGNLLLARLRTGVRIGVAGPGRQRLCYRVTRRQQVRATAALSGYYDTTGAPRLAILVCSGKRRGPGDWTHRTIWWADPVRTDPRR